MARAQKNLGNVLKQLGDCSGALAQYTAALGIYEAALGPHSSARAMCLNNIANVLKKTLRYDDSVAAYRQALDCYAACLAVLDSGKSIDTATLAMASSAKMMADADAGWDAAGKASAARRAVEADAARCRNNLANVLYESGRFEEALDQYQTALAVKERLFGSNNAEVAKARKLVVVVSHKLKQAQRRQAKAQAKAADRAAARLEAKEQRRVAAKASTEAAAAAKLAASAAAAAAEAAAEAAAAVPPVAEKPDFVLPPIGSASPADDKPASATDVSDELEKPIDSEDSLTEPALEPVDVTASASVEAGGSVVDVPAEAGSTLVDVAATPSVEAEGSVVDVTSGEDIVDPITTETSEPTASVEPEREFIELRDLSDEYIKSVFEEFDADGSGDLDTFELSHAVAKLDTGHSPTGNQIVAMIEFVGATQNRLSLKQFGQLARCYDWESVKAEELPEGHFELVFPEASLGFAVQDIPSKGTIVVSRLTNCALSEFLPLGSTVLAVNGAPLGFVTDPGVLAQKVGPLRRPIKITFDSTPLIPSELNDDRIRDIFNQFDADNSGDLDTFELFHAVEELTGKGASTAQVSALVAFAGSDSNVLSIEQFTNLVREFDWSADVQNLTLPDHMLELDFPEGSLGFAVQDVPSRGTIVVSRLLNPRLAEAGLSLGNTVVAINGAPLGFVTDPGVLARKVGPLRRPIKITFEKTPMIPNELNDDRIRDIFNQFDANNSGDLDTFELFHAVEEMTGHPPSTVLIGAMVDFAGASETNNALDLDQFMKLVRQFDWEAEEHAIGLPEGLYEVDFPNQSLGFSVQKVPGKGMISVSKIGAPELKSELSIGDTVLAVNGAPLGVIEHPSDLGERVGPLRRPVRITFEKMKPPNPADFTDERIADIFNQFDVDGSGDLDTFELYHAVAEILGRVPSTAIIGAMVKFVGADNNVLSLEQFSTLVHAFDWDDPSLKEGLPDGHFEVTFNDKGLGFAVATDEKKGTMVVSRIGNQHLKKVLSFGDSVVAINGAPLGFVTDPAMLAKKVGPMRRPLRITFAKAVEGEM